MDSEQLDAWFSYHAPTADTAPEYAKIRTAEDATLFAFGHWEACVDEPPALAYQDINRASRAFAEAVLESRIDGAICRFTPCADQVRAVDCIRLARNAANEAITQDGGARARLFAMARTEIQKARWLANSAIACGGK
jgi:hypothetical protein